MGWSMWACNVWGINLSENESLKARINMSDLYHIINAIGYGNDFPEGFHNDDGNLLPAYLSLKDCRNCNEAVMNIYGNIISEELPYIYEVLNAGGSFEIALEGATEYEGDVFLGFGLLDLPFLNGTSHLPSEFLNKAQHFAWVMSG